LKAAPFAATFPTPMFELAYRFLTFATAGQIPLDFLSCTRVKTFSNA
jgi:hypothetical protein